MTPPARVTARAQQVKMRRQILFLMALLLMAALAPAQQRRIPQGSGTPGLSSIPGSLDGPGYLEVGMGHSGLTSENASWNDFYVKGMLSGGKNAFDGEFIRQARYGDAGWYTLLGWTRTLSADWYSSVHAGTSFGGFFIPKLHADAFINRKFLAKRQFVGSLGFGYDKSKQVNHATVGHMEGAYYFQRFPIVAQAGVDLTHSQPGSILARAQHVAVSYGHDKERYISGRYEFGREAYELVGSGATLFNFPIHNVSVTWREWIGFNWGLNLVIEHDRNPNYRRTGGSLGFFLDF
jgi:YaiO family outer membrane protein